MSLIRKYMQEANFSAHEKWNNADGFVDSDLQFTANDNYMGADAQGMGYSPAPQAQPYIIQVSNASATAVANFDVLGAYQYINNTGFNNGNLTISNCVISSAISNVTYQEFLYQSMNSPFSVGLTYLESVTSTAGQVTQTLTLNTRDANGNQALKTLVPTIDPYQQQNYIIAMKQNYRIDGFTKLTIASVLGAGASGNVLRIHFYPADNINIARGLAGNAVSRQFASPNIVRSSVAVVGGETIQARLG